MTDTSPLFTPIAIGSLELRNRVAMAPMTRRMCSDDRVPTIAMAEYYAKRAHHGVGLIISEGAAVDAVYAPPKRKADAKGCVPGIYSDEQIAGWKRVTDAVHDEGGAIACQLWHTGRFGGEHSLGPSAWKSEDDRYDCTAMTEDDIAKTIADFTNAAINAKLAGFDAVEIHGAHGYLLHAFLDPIINTRTDSYGGSLGNRMRFPLEVTAAVRTGVGEAFPIIYRFSQWAVEDYERITLKNTEEVGLFCRAIVEAGADSLHPSTRDFAAPAFEGSTKTLAGITKRATDATVIAVGRVTTSQTFGDSNPLESTNPAPAIDLIEKGDADIIAVGRSLIANPDWCEKVRTGKWNELKAFEMGMLDELV